MYEMGGDIGLFVQTFEESMKEKIAILREFLGSLEYQVQFWDGQMLQVLERDSAALFRMAKACLSKERRMQSTRGETPTTWEQSTSSAMFYSLDASHINLNKKIVKKLQKNFK